MRKICYTENECIPLNMERLQPGGESEENIEYPIGCFIGVDETDTDSIYGNPDYKPDVEQPNFTYPHPILFVKDTPKPLRK